MVKVFDDVVDFATREHIYTFAKNSLYKIGNSDADAIETANHQYLFSDYSELDVQNSRLLSAIEKDSRIMELIGRRRIASATMNLSRPCDNHWAHVHNDRLVLLYYVNKYWEHQWAGETLFYNKDMKGVFFTSMYTPGRIIVFDGSVPHSIRPQAVGSPGYRFTYSIFFEG